MARIEGRSPRVPKGTTPKSSTSDQPGRPSLSKRVAEPISGRRGRFGYYSGFRPSQHRWIGVALIVGGILIAVANDTMLFIDQAPAAVRAPGAVADSRGSDRGVRHGLPRAVRPVGASSALVELS